MVVKNYLLLRKNGNFYHAYDEDALIIKYLCNYRVINGRAGFPLSAFNKVIGVLEEEYINYTIKGEEEVNEKKFKNKNKYKKILAKANLNNENLIKIEEINERLGKLSYQELLKVISFMEGFTSDL